MKKNRKTLSAQNKSLLIKILILAYFVMSVIFAYAFSLVTGLILTLLIIGGIYVATVPISAEKTAQKALKDKERQNEKNKKH